MNSIKLFEKVGSFGIVVLAIVLNKFLDSSLLAEHRFWLGNTTILGLILIILLGYRQLVNPPWTQAATLALIILSVGLSSFATQRAFFWLRPTQDLGQRLIVGYRQERDIVSLVNAGRVAGVYLTERNLQGQNLHEVAALIDRLQTTTQDKFNRQLIIAADQEGGLVSHLSPPLSRTPTLGEVLDTDDQLSATEHQAILKIAQTHGEELSRLGVNVNFAPVVDLSQTGSAGGYSQITQRAISKHPKLVNLVKNIYCFELAKFEITCTLKHFPGLGGVNQDTHLELGRKDGVVADLKEDISAFQTFESDHLVMLSHTIVPAIDPDHPISLSSKGLSWLRDINPRAKTITDDLSMLPISDGYGVKKAYNLARQAGVDYILISYDPELVYELL